MPPFVIQKTESAWHGRRLVLLKSLLPYDAVLLIFPHVFVSRLLLRICRVLTQFPERRQHKTGNRLCVWHRFWP